MADAERHVHSRGSLALGGRFAGKSVRVIRSQPVVDRGSVFVAHLAFPVTNVAEANAALSALKRACAGDVVDHAMSAWRIPKKETHTLDAFVTLVSGGDSTTSKASSSLKRKPTTQPKKCEVDTFFDDDGESRGGASIRAELNALDAVGVACVVTRAYGGVNLGKKRFEHIRERVSKLIQAAGIEPGRLASSDAFLAIGAGRTLGGVGSGESLAGALGAGGSVGVSTAHGAAEYGVPPPREEKHSGEVRGASASEIESLFSRGKKRKAVTPSRKTIPASVAGDIRARLAEAAERRMRAAAETKEVGHGSPPSSENEKNLPPTFPGPPEIVNLCEVD
jgi:putative IMPACT (imprinted ancient) family translation regulator